MKFARLWLGLVAIASIALTGCSKREDLKLAEVKDRVITIHEYEDAYGRVKPEFLPKKTGEEGKREFLDTMVNRDVMAVKADELGYDKDPSVAQGMEAFRRMTDQVAFLRKQIGEIKVSDADVQRFYDLKGTTINFKRILCDRKEQADEAYDALKKGDEFTAVLTRYSTSDDAKDGGTVISAPFGALLPQLDEPVFKLPVGGFTEPIFTPQGWVIIQVVKIDKTKKNEEKFEDVKERIRTQIQNERETVAVNDYTETLREKYGVTWNYDSMEIIFKALPPDKPVDAAMSRDQEVYPLLYFEAGDLDKPVVSYPGRTISIKDFSDLYDRASFYNRPRREMRLGGIRGFLTVNIMNDISSDAIAKSNIESDPEVKKLLDTKHDELMVSLMYEDLVNKKTIITYDRLQGYYNDNQASLRSPERRNFGIVITGDQETALKAQEEMLAGKPMAVVAASYSTDSEVLEKKGQTGLVLRGEIPDADNVGFSMQSVGEVSTPFQVSNGWMVLKLMELSPERTFTFDESRDRIEAALREQDNDKRLKELLAKWKDEYKVVIHDENLKKVKLPERVQQQIQDIKGKKEKDQLSKS
ncbi:MAG TPA: peptidyl-prolyl cis-trans isomerase [Candidatus Krumholzibacteria bacterium]|nr:peptidyl-prolyl cis-trans isomerase [Candidatus Krumholzibacteria bacterium]